LEGVNAAAGFAFSSLLLRTSRTWESITPYLHPWHRKKGFGVEEQLRKECSVRGLPQLLCLKQTEFTFRGQTRSPVHFHRFRSKRGLVQPDTSGSFWRLTFVEPIAGPIALGFGCHYGLGLFKPLIEGDGVGEWRARAFAPLSPTCTYSAIAPAPR
jgi:CRISPR-associated protein Csb2